MRVALITILNQQQINAKDEQKIDKQRKQLKKLEEMLPGVKSEELENSLKTKVELEEKKKELEGILKQKAQDMEDGT